VTGDKRFFNAYLTHHPYQTWADIPFPWWAGFDRCVFRYKSLRPYFRRFERDRGHWRGDRPPI